MRIKETEDTEKHEKYTKDSSALDEVYAAEMSAVGDDAGMSSIFSGMTSLIQAELEIQTAAIEKRYDKEILQAEGNNYKVKKLEEEKQKELANKKNEANKKNLFWQIYGKYMVKNGG